MSPAEEATLADWISLLIVGITPGVVGIFQGLTPPWWLIAVNWALAWVVSGKVRNHILAERLKGEQ